MPEARVVVIAGQLDVDVVDVLAWDVRVGAALKLRSVVGLDVVDGEGEFCGNAVRELDRGLFAQWSVDL